jgi:hypothetical protein
LKIVDVTPRPTDEEAAAIVLALEAISKHARSNGAPLRRTSWNSPASRGRDYIGRGRDYTPVRSEKTWREAARAESLDDGV